MESEDPDNTKLALNNFFFSPGNSIVIIYFLHMLYFSGK